MSFHDISWCSFIFYFIFPWQLHKIPGTELRLRMAGRCAAQAGCRRPTWAAQCRSGCKASWRRRRRDVAALGQTPGMGEFHRIPGSNTWRYVNVLYHILSAIWIGNGYPLKFPDIYRPRIYGIGTPNQSVPFRHDHWGMGEIFPWENRWETPRIIHGDGWTYGENMEKPQEKP